MKKYIYILMTIFLLSSCDNFLDQKPISSLTSDNYYSNVNEITNGIYGCYVPLLNIYNSGSLTRLLGIASDDLSSWKLSYDATDLLQKTYNDSYSGIWASFYTDIERCNRMIKTIGDGNYSISGKSDSTAILALQGEARFLRAFDYFNLVRLWGDVPFVTEPYDNPSKAVGSGRTSVNKIYSDLIIPDLKFAADNCYLKGSVPAGRVTAGAAQTVLAEALMTLGKYSEAETYLDKVINSQKYSLAGSLNDLIPDGDYNSASINNSESIFELQYSTQTTGCLFSTMVGWEIAPAVKVTATNNAVWVDPDLISAMKNSGNNQRLNSWIVQSATLPGGSIPINDPYPKKLIPRTGTLGNPTNTHLTLYRYADVILLKAECLLAQSKSIDTNTLELLNNIRKRAEMPVWSSNDVTMANVMNERRFELCFEGHRWFDLLRWNKAQTIMESRLGTSISKDQLIFPIPNGEIMKDGSLVQNPGY